MPKSLRAAARWERVGEVPVMMTRPAIPAGERMPVVIWMHGRTVQKEIDPGRYLRWLRAGICACAVDLPGHGERFDASLQQPSAALDVVKQMASEVDGLVEFLRRDPTIDMGRMGVGGMSAGGMAALVRLCRPHEFCCASVEATSGSWRWQADQEMFAGRREEAAGLDPIMNMGRWREIPIQAIHCKADEWMDVRGQEEFLDALRARYAKPELIEWVEYERTGAPHEHAGFGRWAADAKNRQAEFLVRRLEASAQ